MYTLNISFFHIIYIYICSSIKKKREKKISVSLTICVVNQIVLFGYLISWLENFC